MNAKKKALAILAGISLMLPLAACGNKAVATTSGGKITESEYYSSMKQTSAGKQVLQQMILDKVLESSMAHKSPRARSTVNTMPTRSNTVHHSQPFCSKMA